MSNVTLIRFPEGMLSFDDPYWHALNEAAGQQGEYTLCGIAFDGEANYSSNGLEAKFKTNGKITCKRCISVISFCKNIPANKITPTK